MFHRWMPLKYNNHPEFKIPATSKPSIDSFRSTTTEIKSWERPKKELEQAGAYVCVL